MKTIFDLHASALTDYRFYARSSAACANTCLTAQPLQESTSGFIKNGSLQVD